MRTGKWFFVELDGPDAPPSKRRWETSIEVIGKFNASESNLITTKNLPSEPVMSVVFDPNQVSPRLVYHGLEGWLERPGRTSMCRFQYAG